MYVDLAVAEMISRDSRPTTRTSPLERQRTILTEAGRILRIVTERVSSRSLFLPPARAFRARNRQSVLSGSEKNALCSIAHECVFPAGAGPNGLDPVEGKTSDPPRLHAGPPGQSGHDGPNDAGCT
eukprot:scaffold59476_cov51-Phaeocystis_antarctica.AAC.1